MGNKHKWDLFTDTCDKCGIKRRKMRYTTKDTRVIRGYGYQYFVKNTWQHDIPNCIKQIS